MKILRSITIVLLAMHLASAHADEGEDQQVAEFLASCDSSTLPASGIESYRLRRFGESEAMANQLFELIRSGEKTGTFALPWLYEGDANATPVVGGYTVVTEFDGKPGLLLRTTGVETVPYREITEEHTQIEGPGARPLAAWRQIHRTFWEPALERVGKAFSEEMPVTVERFEVICRAGG